MTYEEYKNSKNEKKKKSFLKGLINKFLVVIIFVMLILIGTNYSPEFKSFIEDKVLGSTFDFSKVNKFLSGVTDVFKEDEEVLPVIGEVSNSEKYLDGVKYKCEVGESVKVKDSGIVTFIGEKEGYNNTVIVQQSNGYYAWYGNVKEEVKIYDYIEAGNLVGTSLSNEHYYVLLKDGNPIEINEN